MIVVYHQIRNISAISWQEQVTFDRDDNDASFVLDENTELDFDSANSLNQHAVGRHIAPLRHIIMILSSRVFVLTS